MKKTSLLCLSCLATLTLAACGGKPAPVPNGSSSEGISSETGDSSLSVAPDSSESSLVIPGGGTINVPSFQTALDADYSNVKVTYYQEYSGTGESAIEYYVDDYLIVDDWTAAEMGYEGYSRYSAYHQYEGDWYTFWPKSQGYEYDGWLNKGYRDADLSPYNAYFTLPHLLEALTADDVELILGSYFVKEDRVERIVNSAFEFYGDPFVGFNDLKSLAFSLDEEGRFSRIVGSVSSDSDDGVIIQFDDYGTAVSPIELPPAPSPENIHTYREMKGDSYVEDVYPTGISLALGEGSSSTLVIDDSAEVIASIAPENANYYEVTWTSSDPSVATFEAKSHWTKNHRYLTGVGVGKTTITASVKDQEGKTLTSNAIEITVTDIPAQNKEGAVYDFLLTGTEDANKEDGTYDHTDIHFTNLVDTLAPYFIQGHNVRSLEAKNTDSFGPDGLVLVATPSSSEFMNKGFYSSVDFDFGTQQVSALSFHYALHRAGQKGDVLSGLSDAYIALSNDGVTYGEPISILEEMKGEFEKINVDSVSHLKLLEASFAPSSKVRLYFKANMVGKNISLCMDDFVFAADENCHGFDQTPSVPVETVQISLPSSRLKVGSTAQISSSVTPSDATDKRLTYTSSHPEVASVSETGLVTALHEGTTEITATSVNGIASEPITLEVYAQETLDEKYVGKVYKGEEVEGASGYYPVSLEILSSTSARLMVKDGETTHSYDLDYLGKNEEAIAPYAFEKDGVTLNVKFSSSGCEFFLRGAAIDFGNTYTNLGAELSLYVASQQILVKESSSSSSTISSLSLVAGSTKSLVASVTPTSAYYQKVTATSSNEEVATIVRHETSNFYTVTALKEGTANLVFTNEDGITSTVVLNVTAPVVLESFSLSADKTSIDQGATATLTPTFVPANPDSVNLTYVSSDPKIATVAKNRGANTATVTGLSAGTVTITATDSVSQKTASIEITVTASASLIPASLVGTYEGEDLYNGYVTSITITADGNLRFVVDEYGCDFTLPLESSNGSTYIFSDGENTVQVEVGASGIFVTLNDGEYYDDALCYDGSSLFGKQ